ncbi:thioredoxin family protein [Malaciobacter molluscorum]|nr:DUF255 domain-containing protein [Malaciobacter molluscorum]
MKKILLLSLLFLSFLYAKIDDNEVISKANNLNKQILVYVFSKNCYYCMKMDKEVFAEKEVQNAINKNYILLKVDAFKDKLPFSLQKKYKKITPSFFILDKNGKYQNSIIGSWTKKDFLEILKENLK